MPFPLINEFAVLGTTFFMMALTTFWYSPLLFGNVWMRENGWSDVPSRSTRDQWLYEIVPTFVAYVVVCGIIATIIPLARSLAVSPFAVAVAGVLVVNAALVAVVVFERRTWRYAAVHGGFVTVLIGVGTALLATWPW